MKRYVFDEGDLYKFLSHLVSSAYLMYSAGEKDLDDSYPSFYLVGSAIRLIHYLHSTGQLEGDPYLSGFLEDLRSGLSLRAYDEESFIEFLGNSTRELAKEMKRRKAD